MGDSLGTALSIENGDKKSVTTKAATAATSSTPSQATITSDTDTAAAQVIQDLNTNNFAGAWQTALSTSPLYGTNYNTQTTDPLLSALESSSGLQELDPTKQWTASETDAYYAALQENPVFHGQTVKGEGGGTESLGQDPYGLWGSASGITSGSDAAANLSQEGVTPDVGRFAGAKPSTSFLDKYGADIVMLAAAVAAPEAIPAIEGVIGAEGVAGAVEAGAIYGGAVGATKGAITGGNIGEDALIGAAVGGVGSGVSSELSSLGTPSGVSNLAGGVAKAETGALVSGALTSPSGQGTSGAGGTTTALSPGVAPAAGATAGATAVSTPNPISTIDPVTGLQETTPAPSDSTSTSTSTTPGFISGLESGLGSSLGSTGGNLLNTLGQDIGGMAPYLAVAGVGIEQANTGEAQAATYSQEQQNLAQPAITQSNTLLNQYNAGTIDPLSQAQSTSEIAQGNAILNNPQMSQLSTIAQTAFADYASGNLKPADQTQLDQNTAAAKQQVASQLAAAGITDSSVLAGQYQQIDNNAQIQKQTILNSYFATGTSAYDTWLQTTTEGQQTIQQGMAVASNALQTELANSMAEANIGIGEMNTAITTQMQTDAEYANQVSTLLGTLATAYAKSVAGTATSGGGTSAPGGGTTIVNPGGSVPLSSTGPLTGVGATNAAGTALANTPSISDPSLAGDISAQTIPATSTNAMDIQQAGNDILSSTPNPAGTADVTGSGSVPYIMNADGTMTDPVTGAVIGGSTADTTASAITGSSSSWLSDLGGGSYYG